MTHTFPSGNTCSVACETINQLSKNIKILIIIVHCLSWLYVCICRMYDLVPIAAEDYGDMTASFKVVAAARKRDLYMTLFNLKSKWMLNATLTAILSTLKSWNSSHPFVICFQLAFWSFVVFFFKSVFLFTKVGKLFLYTIPLSPCYYHCWFLQNKLSMCKERFKLLNISFCRSTVNFTCIDVFTLF